MQKIDVNTDEADRFGISDRELIKTLYKKVILLEDRVNSIEIDTQAHEQWIMKREKK